MPTPITFTITTVGRAAALDAFNNGLTIALTEIAIGDDSYTPTGSETALSNELDRFNLPGGTVEALSATLRFSAAITATTHTDIYELGLFTSTGVLFALASTISTTIPLTVAEANIDTICAFGLVLGDVPASSLTITLDPSAPLAIQLVNQHVGAENPHPQYATDADLESAIEVKDVEILALHNDLDGEVAARQAADVALAITIGGKAALAGSNTQPFKVGTATNDDEAVRRDQLTSMSGAIKTAVLQMIYQVGQPYFNKLDARNPNAIYGVTIGTWVQEKGRFLVGFDEAQEAFDLLADTGGKTGHKMTTNNLIQHNHPRNADSILEGVISNVAGINGVFDNSGNYLYQYSVTGNAGQADPEAIPTLPPYVVYSWWVRTA